VSIRKLLEQVLALQLLAQDLALLQRPAVKEASALITKLAAGASALAAVAGMPQLPVNVAETLR